MITKCHEKVLCYHVIYTYIYKNIFCNVCTVVLLKSVSSVRLCVCVLQDKGRESGCAEVNEPLCGSSDPFSFWSR